jgi:anti-sigma-K factor RskA
MDELALARWQGAIDERTKVIERRMDSLNGDVRVIRNDIAEIKQSVKDSSDFRASWTSLLVQLRDAASAAKAASERRDHWLEGWRARSVAVAAVLAAAASAVNLAFRLNGVFH